MIVACAERVKLLPRSVAVDKQRVHASRLLQQVQTAIHTFVENRLRPELYTDERRRGNRSRFFGARPCRPSRHPRHRL